MMSDEKETQYTIPQMNELRIECNDENAIIVVLLAGQAEIFGNELRFDIEYRFSGNKSFAIFTWIGCRVVIVGQPKEVPYIPSIAPFSLIQTINVHSMLTVGKRPTLMVTGQPNCGKMTVCTILLNLAVRNGLHPMFIDLNVDLNSISGLPGAIGCTIIKKTSFSRDAYSEFNQDSLLLHFGSHQVSKNIDFFKSQCVRLQYLISQKLKGSHYKDGIIINIPSKNSIGNNNEAFYAMVIDLAKIFSIDSMLVIAENDKLFQTLKVDANLDQKISILNMEKFSGSIDKPARKSTQKTSINSYFNEMQPRKLLCELEVCKIVPFVLSESTLPIGKKQLNKCRFQQESVGLEENFEFGSLVQATDSKHYEQPVLGFVRMIRGTGGGETSLISIDQLPHGLEFKLFAMIK